MLIKHENYDPLSSLNDIAIIKLKDEVILNNYIQTACLPDPNIKNYPNQANIDAWAAGWGTFKSSRLTASVLQDVKLTVYDKEMCDKVVPSSAKDWNSQICAGK